MSNRNKHPLDRQTEIQTDTKQVRHSMADKMRQLIKWFIPRQGVTAGSRSLTAMEM